MLYKLYHLQVYLAKMKINLAQMKINLAQLKFNLPQMKINLAEMKLYPVLVEWLTHRTNDQHGLGSKPTYAILLCPWERHFTALSPAWWS